MHQNLGELILHGNDTPMLQLSTYYNLKDNVHTQTESVGKILLGTYISLYHIKPIILMFNWATVTPFPVDIDYNLNSEILKIWHGTKKKNC